MFETEEDIRSEEAQAAVETISNALESLERIESEIGDLDSEVTHPDLIALHNAYCPSAAALEGTGTTARSAIDAVVAAIMRVVDAILDFFRAEYQSAAKCISSAERIIDVGQKIDATAVATRDVSNMAVIMAISYEGHHARYFSRELDAFYSKIIRMRGTSPHLETKDLISAVRSENVTEIAARLTRVHDKLEDSLKSLGRVVSKDSSPMFETGENGLPVYSTERLMGDRFIFGQISEIKDGSFHYGCSVRRDPSTRMRVKSFPALSPNDIVLTARTIRGFCEYIMRSSDIERTLLSINREANTLVRRNQNRTGVKELRTIVNSFNNVYIVALRHAMYVSRNSINFLLECLRAY